MKYGKFVDKIPNDKKRKRITQYDECLDEFLNSNEQYWKVNLESLNKSAILVLSSLKWRINNFGKYRNIKIVMKNNEIYLERL